MFLLIDNYDSFTYNLWHYLSEAGAEVDVRRNDTLSADDVVALGPQGIILSPGPGTPDQAGICLAVTQRAADHKIPLFGVCLGHQTIGQVFGGKVIRAPEPRHGKLSPIHHRGRSVFGANANTGGLPSPFEATRYHSLVVERDTLPDDLEITAWTDDGLIMGLAHKTLPIHGVQFHPESIETRFGHDLLAEFLNIATRT